MISSVLKSRFALSPGQRSVQVYDSHICVSAAVAVASTAVVKYLPISSTNLLAFTTGYAALKTVEQGTISGALVAGLVSTHAANKFLLATSVTASCALFFFGSIATTFVGLESFLNSCANKSEFDGIVFSIFLNPIRFFKKMVSQVGGNSNSVAQIRTASLISNLVFSSFIYFNSDSTLNRISLLGLNFFTFYFMISEKIKKIDSDLKLPMLMNLVSSICILPVASPIIFQNLFGSCIAFLSNGVRNSIFNILPAICGSGLGRALADFRIPGLGRTLTDSRIQRIPVALAMLGGLGSFYALASFSLDHKPAVLYPTAGLIGGCLGGMSLFVCRKLQSLNARLPPRVGPVLLSRSTSSPDLNIVHLKRKRINSANI